MTDAKLMDVVDAGHKLLEVLTRSLFFEPLVLNDQLKQLPTTCKLHHQVQITFCLDDFVYLNNIWMMQLL